ncbi:MAG: hypothetical protein KDD55_05230, partial [Bdellovibrionales bacterium]|nr:hypothetical protein [Bdellovibrionales bacterium]
TAGGSIYVSDDDGATFSTPTLAGGDINYTLKTTGQRILIGNNLSVDGGDTWQQVEDKSVIDEVEQTTSEMIGFHPTNQDLAFISTEVGLAKTDNLTTDFTLSRANSGLSGVKVLELKRAFNSDRALLLTQAGLGFTDDITAETIHWTFPICADGVDCDVIRSAVFHPTDDTKVYLADGSLYRLDLSFSEGEFSASTTEIGNFSNVTQLSTSSLLQTTLVLMRESADDGLTTLSLTDETTTSDLYTDSPVHSFFPLTSTSWVISTGDAHPLSSSARAVLKTVDSGASFQNIVNGDLPTNALVHEFDYDSENDILYAGTSNDRVSEDEDASISSVFVLSAALEGTGSWVDSADKPEDLSNSAPGITRVVHDSENDIVYAVGGIYLFQSTDRGETWEHIFTNTPGFYIEVFDLIRSVVVLSQSRAQEADKLVVGDSSGLNLLAEEDSSGGGEVEPADYSCSFSISSKCLKKRVPRGKTCKVTANLRNEKEDSGERSRFLFQRRKNSSKPWVRILRDRTKKSGKKKNTFTVLKPGEYRVIFPKVSCETVPVEVRTKKKK